MIKGLSWIAVFCVLSSFVFGRITEKPDQTSDDDILRRPVQGNVEYVGTTEAFHSALSRTKVAGGTIRIINCKEDSIIQEWKPEGAALRNILDELVTRDPRYRWEVEDGVVNLLPSAGEPALLQARINKFELRSTSSLDALNKVLAFSEVKEAMAKLNLKLGLTIVVYSSTSHPKEFAICFKGGTLRQVLNAIAKAHGRDIWRYVETHCDGKHEIAITF